MLILMKKVMFRIEVATYLLKNQVKIYMEILYFICFQTNSFLSLINKNYYLFFIHIIYNLWYMINTFINDIIIILLF